MDEVGEYVLDSRQKDYFYEPDEFGQQRGGGFWQNAGRAVGNIFRQTAAHVNNTGPRRGWDVNQYERFVRELQRRLRRIDVNVQKLQREKRSLERDKRTLEQRLTNTQAELQRAQTLAAQRGVAPTPTARPARPAPPSRRYRARPVRRPVRRPPPRPVEYDDEELPSESGDWSALEPGGAGAFQQFGERTAVSDFLVLETLEGTQAAVMPVAEGLYLVGEMPQNVVPHVTSAQVSDAMGSALHESLRGVAGFAGHWIGRIK